MATLLRMEPGSSVVRVTHLNLCRDFRGGERQMLELMLALRPSVTNRCLVRRDGPFHRRLIPVDGVEVVGVANSPLAALMRASDTDLLHVHDGRSVPVGALRSLLSHTPFVVTRRVLRIPDAGAATRWCYGRAAAVVTVSDAVAADMRGYDARLRISTIADCAPRLEADPSVTARLRAELGGDLIIGHVGALEDASKGQSTLIEAVRIMGERARNMRFVLIGGGKDKAALRARAAGLPNVHLTGWVDNVADYYALMDLFVFPSRFEALGSSLLEAMSFGVPVVATTVGGIPEIVRDGVEGLLVGRDDVQAIADRIQRLAQDGALRRSLGASAQARTQAYSAQRMMLQYLELYRRITAAAPSGEH